MDPVDPTGPLDRDDLDEALAAIVNVEPSPHFVARVRARIHAAPPPSSPWVSWIRVAAAAAVCLVVGVLLVPRGSQIQTDRLPDVPPVVDPSPFRPVVPNPDRTASPETARTERRTPVASPRPQRRRDRIILEDGRLDAWIDAVDHGRIVLAFRELGPITPWPADGIALTELELEPIEIAPIDDEAARERAQ